MKCNQSHPGFELVSPCPFPTTITITPRALYNNHKNWLAHKYLNRNTHSWLLKFLEVPCVPLSVMIQNIIVSGCNLFLMRICQIKVLSLSVNLNHLKLCICSSHHANPRQKRIKFTPCIICQRETQNWTRNRQLTKEEESIHSFPPLHSAGPFDWFWYYVSKCTNALASINGQTSSRVGSELLQIL